MALPQTGATLFSSGDVYSTPGALDSIPSMELSLALTRHLQGDWGELETEDKTANERALKEGGRLVSVYTTLSGTRFYVITEADRSVTTFLLPSEY